MLQTELPLRPESRAGNSRERRARGDCCTEDSGRHLVAFQIANEPDSFRNRYRPAAYTPADYLAEWSRFRDAIAKATPQARFAGPDISNKLIYLTAFAEEAVKYPDVVLLTAHYYAMGPASNPEATLENLLSPEPKLTTLKSKDLSVIAAAEKADTPSVPHVGGKFLLGWRQARSLRYLCFGIVVRWIHACVHATWLERHQSAWRREWLLHADSRSPFNWPDTTSRVFGIRFAQRFVGARAVDAFSSGCQPSCRRICLRKDRQT